MAKAEAGLRERLRAFERGQVAAPQTARDPVNQPMIRHWCDAVGDRNPVYTDPEFAARSVHGTVVAPPTMLQAWIMPGLGPRPEPSAGARHPLWEVLRLLDEAGFTSIVATNCTQEYARYLRPGDELTVTSEIESISDEKKTALGLGHFIDQRMTYRDQRGEVVASMRMRLLKFRPRAQPRREPARRKAAKRPRSEPQASEGGPPQGKAAQRPRSEPQASEGGPPQGRPRPAITPDNAFFWEGVRERKLLIQRCACGKLRHPPGPMCPTCRSLEWDAVESSGCGRVYSFVVAHHPPIPPFEYPNLIALVELEEGTRIVSNLVGVAPAAVRVGMSVSLEFREFEGGQVLPQFRPVGE